MAQTHDIEDVLSSIRRLVANESGPTAKPRLSESDRGDGPALVLDDRHRVTEPEDPFQMIRMLAQEERDGRDAEHLTTALPEELAAITSDLARSDEATRWEDDAESDDEATADEASSDSEIPSDYVEDTDYEADTLQASEEAEADTTETVDAEDMDHDPVEHEAFNDRFTSTKHAPEAEEASEVQFRRKASPLADLSSAIDGDEALRDLISEIVRQELAGELGERITRNVRKLVRREIRQMLASDEFD